MSPGFAPVGLDALSRSKRACPILNSATQI
jgi:hypothetical protein